MPEETDHVTKWIPRSTFQFAGPELVIICIFMGQHPVSTYKYAEPKLWRIVPKVAYQDRYANSRHLLCKTFLSFEKATTDYPTFSQHFFDNLDTGTSCTSIQNTALMTKLYLRCKYNS